MDGVNLQQILLGVFLAATVVEVAYQLKTLDRRGAVAAFLLGTIVFGLGGWAWADRHSGLLC